MERWSDGARPEMAFLGEGDYYGISLDCLRPPGLDNLLAAGRCFAATAGAMSSARVIGTALQTGWAAGTIAASQALNRSVEKAIERLQTALSPSS